MQTRIELPFIRAISTMHDIFKLLSALSTTLEYLGCMVFARYHLIHFCFRTSAEATEQAFCRREVLTCLFFPKRPIEQHQHPGVLASAKNCHRLQVQNSSWEIVPGELRPSIKDGYYRTRAATHGCDRPDGAERRVRVARVSC